MGVILEYVHSIVMSVFSVHKLQRDEGERGVTVSIGFSGINIAVERMIVSSLSYLHSARWRLGDAHHPSVEMENDLLSGIATSVTSETSDPVPERGHMLFLNFGDFQPTRPCLMGGVHMIRYREPLIDMPALIQARSSDMHRGSRQDPPRRRGRGARLLGWESAAVVGGGEEL